MPALDPRVRYDDLRVTESRETLPPGESLADTVAREVHEETGVDCVPVRPHAVDEFTFENDRTGETDGWTSVFFEARAETTDIDDDLGLPGEEITDARWFDALPEDLFHPALTGAVHERCVENSQS